jgi:ketosteroid isomerase-like protein
MSESTFASENEFDELREADAVATLLELNREYIRAFVESDVAWYDAHLSDRFACTLADGTRIDKDAFLRRNAGGPGVSDVTFEVVDVDVIGDVALVHGITHYTRGGAPASTRYTDIWQCRRGRWRAVAAQLTAVAAR